MNMTIAISSLIAAIVSYLFVSSTNRGMLEQ